MTLDKQKLKDRWKDGVHYNPCCDHVGEDIFTYFMFVLWNIRVEPARTVAKYNLHL